MDLVVIVEPSDGSYPGHMVVGQESDHTFQYFGFHLDPDSLPAEHRAPAQWQEYLYASKIWGEIREESDYVRLIRQRASTKIYEKRVTCKVPIELQIPLPREWKHHAHYSFRP